MNNDFMRLSREDKLRYASNSDQLYSVKSYERLDGAAKGTRIYRVATGGGIEFDVLPDNALDLYGATYRGINVSYFSKAGLTRDFTPVENEFLRYYSGGLLYTCGLLNAGPGNREGETWHPLHGRMHGLRAENPSVQIEEDNIVLSGNMREAELFGHNLQLKRKIIAPIGGPEIYIEDTLSNLAPERMEYMILYHMNFGYPFLSEHLRLELPEGTVTTPRTAFAAEGIADACRFTPPIDGIEERVYFHDIPENEGMSRIKLINERLGFGCELSYMKETLPVLVEWKSMKSGDYALGIEPSNSYIHGRTLERENGTLKAVKGFGEVKFVVKLRFFDV